MILTINCLFRRDTEGYRLVGNNPFCPFARGDGDKKYVCTYSRGWKFVLGRCGRGCVTRKTFGEYEKLQ